MIILPLLISMVIPLILLLAKISIVLIIVPVIATRIISKEISKILEDKQGNQTTKSKIKNLDVVLLSVFIGEILLFITSQVGLTATCAAASALVLYICFKDREIGKSINDKTLV